MITRPTTFANFCQQSGAEIHTILELTDGTSTWYFSDVDMQLTDGHVYPLLKSTSGISENFSIYTKKWTVATVTLTLSNIKYQLNSSNEWTNIADQIGDVIGNDASIYLIAGSTATALSDGIERFSGMVEESPSYNADSVTIRLVDTLTTKNIQLPSHILGTSEDITGVPEESYVRRAPLVYGTFRKLYTGGDTGLVPCEIIESRTHPKVLISDHTLNATTSLWTKLSELPEPTKLDSATMDDSETIGSGSYGTGQCAQSSATANYDGEFETGETYLPPTGDFMGSYLTTGSGMTGSPTGSNDSDTNWTNCISNDLSLESDINDQEDTGSGASDYMTGGLYVSWDNYASGTQETNPIGSINSMVGIIDIDFYSDVEYETGFPRLVQYSNNNILQEIVNTYATDGLKTETIFDSTWHDNVVWQLRSGIDHATYDLPAVLGVEAKTKTNTATGSSIQADGVTDNQKIIGLEYIAIRAAHWLKYYGPIFAAVVGREYGSWITEDGRSVGSKSSGDAIYDTVHIVESILRDELGVVTADIDTDSFDDAYDAAASTYNHVCINSDNQAKAFDIIRSIAEQSTFAFVMTAAGKCRAVSLNDKTPTTDATIPHSHIIDGRIDVSRTKTIFNELNISYNWMHERGDYQGTLTETNATSQTDYGVLPYNARWDYLNKTRAGLIADHLVGDADSIWANPHTQISLSTVGFSHADVEVGDWIELDDTTVDPHQLCYGESWSGKQFLITSVRQYGGRTDITAVELY